MTPVTELYSFRLFRISSSFFSISVCCLFSRMSLIFSLMKPPKASTLLGSRYLARMLKTVSPLLKIDCRNFRASSSCSSSLSRLSSSSRCKGKQTSARIVQTLGQEM